MMGQIIPVWRADFFDRVRQRNYLVTLLCMAVLTTLFFPPDNADYATVVIGGYRGIYNSAWMGSTLAILNVFFLPIICFYLVKNAVEKDRQRQIGELIAATPVSKSIYILGKWLSNVSLLIGIMLLMTVVSIGVQLWYGESMQIDPLAILLPQLVYVLPILAVISAAALLFETVPALRGGIGNVGYFFLWVGGIVKAVEDSAGIGVVLEQMRSAVLKFDPHSNGSISVGVNVGKKAMGTFEWQGIDYVNGVWFNHAMMATITAALLVSAIVFFDRFRRQADSIEAKKTQSRLQSLLAKLVTPPGIWFERLTAPFAFTRLVRQECLLLIRGHSHWWYLILLALMTAQIVAPQEVVRMAILPASWILFVLVLSPLGQRELRHGTDPLIFSCVSPLKKQFMAMLVAAVLIGLLAVGGAVIRFSLAGDWFSVAMLVSGVLFVAGLAMACGALTRTSRTFEVLFPAVWYLGPMQRVTALDFVGVDKFASQQANMPVSLLMVSLALFTLAWFGRRLQLQR